MSVSVDFDHRAESRRERLLAVCRVWRSLERFSTGARDAQRASVAMTSERA